ncbi:MAG: 3-deoxy-8-phosphooctulonate synthase [Lutibacter sp.]|nr:3-deoxy-8-phosphooctulonate synthase [Lutibacter sp.]
MQSFYLIAGPCVIESEEHCLDLAKSLIDITKRLNIPFIFKASFDKANRTSLASYRGVGIDEGLRILQLVKDTYNVPILTDIHSVDQVDKVVKVADVIQIPAFLCRQTDLLVEVGYAIANTTKAVNIKKGQFCNHIAMKHAYGKIYDAILEKQNNVVVEPLHFWTNQIWLCDRGNMNGYDDLVVDMRCLVQMREQDSKPVNIVQDATHALQQPNRAGKTMGQRYLIPTIARSAVAAGIDGLFMEVHDNPPAALSDATTQWPLKYLEPLLVELLEIHKVTQGRVTYYVDKDY